MACVITEPSPETASESATAGLSRAERTQVLLDDLQRSTGAEAERVTERIVEVNMELAQTLARRYYGHGERSDDLDQTAYLGLTKAVRRFDPERGKEFLAFAVPTILGELRRHFRDGCWMVRPPRRVQELQGRMMPVIEEFAQGQGRNPDPWELAEILDATIDDVIEALTADGCFTPSSLDQPLQPTSSVSLGDMLGEEEHQYEEVDTHLVLKPLVEQLPERDHRVIELRFFWDWTQEQIAEEIGVTQMQVSRILARIKERLRRQMGDRTPIRS